MRCRTGRSINAEIDSIQTIAGDNEPYKVAFTSTLTIYGVSGAEAKVSYQDEREIVRTTRNFRRT